MMRQIVFFLSFCALAVLAGELPVYDSAVIAAGQSAVRAVSSGKALKAALKSGAVCGRNCAVVTVTDGEPSAGGKWAALGFQFEQPAAVPCQGVRWQLAVPEEMTIAVEVKHLPDVRKGFWNGWRIGVPRKVTLKPGIQTLDVYWNECGVKGGDIAKANGVVLTFSKPEKLGVLSFSLIISDASQGSGTAVRFFDPTINKINPVARPADAMTMALNGFPSGKGLKSSAPDSASGFCVTV